MAQLAVWAKMVTEIAKVVGNWQVSREKRKMGAALEAGQRYIFCNEKEGEFKDIDDDRQQKLLKHYRKRFFNYD